jgi:coenzyme F420-0:L-glutamate ligase/coenzyme F420-1:gamma-L-glutamate ligase
LLAVSRFGHIGVNAGIDRSNVGDGLIQLLPKTLQACGLPFRTGVACVAVGWQGIAALRD